MRVAPLSDVLGATLVDFDITKPCTPEEQEELRTLLVEHHLLLVRDQATTADDQTRFVGYFGPVHTRADGMKETYVTNRIVEGQAIGSGTAKLLWHQDGTYGPRPGIATSLWAEEVEPGTVPTLFANAVRLLERLPVDLRTRIEPLRAVHFRDTYVETTDVRYREENLAADAPPGRYMRYEHPIVYRMPHVERDTILAHEFMTSHVIGMPRAEGEALLQELWSVLYADDNVYAHHWQNHDVIIWDNLSLHHCRPAEMGLPTRRLRRQSIDGWYSRDGLLDWIETVRTYVTAGAEPSGI